jgi:hypothetical protein
MLSTPTDSYVDVFSYAPWPPLENGECEMEFHLIYQGQLPAAGQGGGKTRTPEKHAIRKVLHKQLASLWNSHPFLIDFMKMDESKPQGGYAGGPERPKHNYANRYLRCGYRFRPLISKFLSVSCALDILFLRRDGPGSLVKHGGDIDNRLKVLFDALRMPQTCDEVCGESPAQDEDPFYCLLEDDALISKVQVDTNWLLTPPGRGEHIHDVHLVIRVKSIMAEASSYETAFV